MKLELQNVRQEIAHVRHVRGYVILGAGVEIGLGAARGRRDPLVLLAKLPPGLVVLLGRNLAGKDFPPPLIDHQSKRRNAIFSSARCISSPMSFEVSGAWSSSPSFTRYSGVIESAIVSPTAS